MSTNTVTNSTLSAARKRDEMLEPYEWKRSRTVLRREGASNRPDLVDTWSRSWTIRELDDRATAVRDLSWLESGALLHITYETEKDGTLTVDFVPDAELTDPGDLCGYPAE